MRTCCHRFCFYNFGGCACGLVAMSPSILHLAPVRVKVLPWDLYSQLQRFQPQRFQPQRLCKRAFHRFCIPNFRHNDWPLFRRYRFCIHSFHDCAFELCGSNPTVTHFVTTYVMSTRCSLLIDATRCLIYVQALILRDVPRHLPFVFYNTSLTDQNYLCKLELLPESSPIIAHVHRIVVLINIFYCNKLFPRERPFHFQRTCSSGYDGVDFWNINVARYRDKGCVVIDG